MSYNPIDCLNNQLCEPLAEYSSTARASIVGSGNPKTGDLAKEDDIRVVELFAGVGGFRIGLERASKLFKTVWSNQWEPSTKRQDASLIYRKRFGEAGHSNKDINTIPADEIPNCDLLCGGFPCQDYSVATTLKRSAGIEGKKGVLWWQIFRILHDKGADRPRYLMLENVDRLLNSPASQRGRDFAIILSSLSKLGYSVEWRVINAADYGMPQRRRRTYIIAYAANTDLALSCKSADKQDWILDNGIMPKAFPCERKDGRSMSSIVIGNDIASVSDSFNKGGKASPFGNSGIMHNGVAYTLDTTPVYGGPYTLLRDIVIDDDEVPEDFFIPSESVDKWEYAKGSKSLLRINKSTGFEYRYSEGSMAFPDPLDKASRTIITGEGGAAPSRFKHVIMTSDGRYRRLTPVELERLNMFPDNHTAGASDTRRAFLMGNSLVTGIVERIALSLLSSASPSGRTGTMS